MAAPTAGTATIDGLAYDQLPDPVRQVGAALDSGSFHPGRSAAQHLRIIATATGLPRRRVDEVLGLILGILAAGSEFRHRTIIPVLLAAPHRARVFAVKVAVIAGLGAIFSAVLFGLGLATIVLTLSAHGIHHLPSGVGQLYLGTVISSACFGMIGVALGALTRNTIGAIVAAITWALFIEQVILATIVPGIEKWLRHRVARGGQSHHHAARPGLMQAAPAKRGSSPPGCCPAESFRHRYEIIPMPFRDRYENGGPPVCPAWPVRRTSSSRPDEPASGTRRSSAR